jgi:2-iminobutanoate/2-iminopropanoate deaminase
MKEFIATGTAPQAIGPYSQAVKMRIGEALFCSGQIPIDPESGQVVEGPPDVQTDRVMRNLKAIIEAGGFTMEDVVKTTIFLTDMTSFAGVNKVYESYFHGTFPARSTVQASALPRGISVEIEAIACK